MSLKSEKKILAENHNEKMAACTFYQNALQAPRVMTE